MIKIIFWSQPNSDEPSAWYRLDEPGAGDRFFKNLLDNAEADGREVFGIQEVTELEWAEAQTAGEAMA